jgi:DNA-binding CsgD family transcriptional regulator
MSHVVVESNDPFAPARGPADTVARATRQLACAVAALVGLSQPADAEPADDARRERGAPRAPAPAVLAFDGRGRLVHRSASAAALLDVLPTAAADAHGGEGGRTVRGRDGQAYLVHVVPAAAADAADPGAPSTFVVIAALGTPETGATVEERYGLSPREREILRRVSRGDATKAIAASLGLSAHTVQEYVGRACRKAGVRTRRELVARLLEPAAGA